MTAETRNLKTRSGYDMLMCRHSTDSGLTQRKGRYAELKSGTRAETVADFKPGRRACQQPFRSYEFTGPSHTVHPKALLLLLTHCLPSHEYLFVAVHL